MSSHSSTHNPASRCRLLNQPRSSGESGDCIIYVMARDQRVNDNAALYEAQQAARRLRLPLVVIFCVQAKTGVRAREHYVFILKGLEELEHSLTAKQIAFHVVTGKPSEQLPKAFTAFKPAAIYFDFNPLRGPIALHRAIATQAQKAAVYEVDAHNIVPVWVASDKQETAARTIRRKIMNQLSSWLVQDMPITKHPYRFTTSIQSLNDMHAHIDKLLKHVEANGTDISRFHPGERAAQKALDDFLTHRLEGYASRRNDPTKNGQSELNPYLHYGQLASARVVRAVEAAAHTKPRLRADADTFIEEIVVRKELSDNFCFYNTHYDSLKGAPSWAQKSLQNHASDNREFIYTRSQFEAAETHDAAWNAAQMQLRTTGKIHGYMRMYWAKKVLEWSKTLDAALQTLLYLNDHYHIDGGDPNGYVGILWSIAGLHDRPWFERPVYGQIRYMNANGLKRKFAIQQYIDAYSGGRQGS